MKKIALLIIFFILIFIAYGYWNATPGVEEASGNSAKIQISPLSHDFGDADYGQVLNFSFTVKNTGNENLEIKRVATSCSCTTAKVLKEILLPGEETELQVTYDTGAMSGPHGMGEQERIIFIKNSDPANPQAEVMIYANVK